MQFQLLERQQLFPMGMSGYFTFRIPVITRAANGDILAFAEARRDSDLDYGCIDIVMRKSRDGGRTWEELRVLFADGENTFGNQCPIVDRETGDICMLFCTNPGDGGEALIDQGKAERRMYRTVSRDHGETWSEAEDITAQVRRPGWTWLASGPCHALQLTSGRYVVPCNHKELGHEPSNESRSHVIYSDDKGVTWSIGAELPWGTNECTAAEWENGLYLNMRSCSSDYQNVRVSAVSWDEGLTFSPLSIERQLVDPHCQGTVLPYQNSLLFCNAASVRREQLTLRYRLAGASSWETAVVVEQGAAAYSDLVIGNEQEILVLYETGRETPYEGIWIARVAGE